MKNIILQANEYESLLTTIKEEIQKAHYEASLSQNSYLINLYWTIGQLIGEKQKQFGWGKSVVENLSKDLQREYTGKLSFSPDNLWRMRQMFTEYTSHKFLEQLVYEIKNTNSVFLGQAVPEIEKSGSELLGQAVPEIEKPTDNSEKQSNINKLDLSWIRKLVAAVSWGHNILIMKKCKNPAERIFYLKYTALMGWNRDMLLNQIKSNAYRRFINNPKDNNFGVTMPKYLSEQAGEALKSVYNLEFLDIKQPVLERELEARLIHHIKNFILELGYGFCFIGNQYRITLGENEYFIDLLFYHRFLKALVAIELKTSKFEPEYAGKMDFYLNVLNENEKGEGDNPAIGIILCADHDALEVEFSLKTKNNSIGVAEYILYNQLPEDFRGKLPTTSELKQIISFNTL